MTMKTLALLASFCALGDAVTLDKVFGVECGHSYRLGIHYVQEVNFPVSDLVESGSPVSVMFMGKTRADILEGEVTIKVLMTAPSDPRGDMITYGEFELDLCSQVAGIQCPMSAGTEFEGVITWNAPRMTPEVFYEAQTRDLLVASGGGRNGHVTVVAHIAVDEQGAFTCNEVVFGILPEEEYVDGVGSPKKSTLEPAIDPMLVAALNARADKTWTAEQSPRFENYSVMDARRIAGGTVMRGHKNFEDLPRRKYAAPSDNEERRLRAASVAFDDEDDIPDYFDTREAFPECAEVVGRIRDQSDCGSCWAFASTEAFNDRRCIAAIGKENGEEGDMLVELSTEDTTACCSWFHCGMSMGCNGGQPGSAWKWFASTGVVTGGDYADIGKGTTCKPYEFQPCAHHVDPGASGYPVCPDSEYPTPECLSSCSESTFSTTYQQDKRKAKEAYSLIGVQDIQRDMMKYGSVTAAFSVYSDFVTYSSGVYKYVQGSYLGGHAVKIIGWGKDADSGEDYWLVANSWNDSWGEKGLFRILRGANECGIEGQIVAGEA